MAPKAKKAKKAAKLKKSFSGDPSRALMREESFAGRPMPKRKKPDCQPTSREELQNKAVCKALFQFKKDLNIKNKDLAEILAVDTRTLSRWQEAEQIANFSDKRVREPISNFLGIVATLTEMFSHSDGREAWLKTPHPQLQKAPLELIGESLEQLINVRQYLDYVSSRGA